jgi:hypothetical protein
LLQQGRLLFRPQTCRLGYWTRRHACQASPQQSQQAAQRQHGWRLSQALAFEQPVAVEQPLGLGQTVKSKQKLAATNTTLVPVAKIGAF